MWLVPRETKGCEGRTAIPSTVRDALERWYTGAGSEADHRASVILVVKARDHGQWIACDCRGSAAPPPLLSPAYLSEAETYYLRRLTSQGRERPEHRLDCPFFRDQAPPRHRERATAAPRLIAPPEGFFAAHRLAPEKLAQSPANTDPDDRARGASTPRLASLLWLLLERAGCTVIEPLPASGGPERSMARSFGRLRLAAERLKIAPGVALARFLYNHVDPFERRVVFARLREAAPGWPADHAPQAFLVLYATEVSGDRLTLAEGRTLTLRNRVQHPGVRAGGAGPPYLALVLVGEHNPRDGYDALRGYAQPILGPRDFIPVDSPAERDALEAVVRLQYRLRRRLIGLAARKPLFAGLDDRQRPSFLVSSKDFGSGATADFAVSLQSGEAEGASEPNAAAPVRLTPGGDVADELEAAIMTQLAAARRRG